MPNVYDLGDVTRISNGTFTLSGTPYDPDAVSATVRAISGSQAVYTYDGGSGSVQRLGTGVYYYDLPITEAGGYYTHGWNGYTNAQVQTYSERRFYVRVREATE